MRSATLALAAAILIAPGASAQNRRVALDRSVGLPAPEGESPLSKPARLRVEDAPLPSALTELHDRARSLGRRPPHVGRERIARVGLDSEIGDRADDVRAALARVASGARASARPRRAGPAGARGATCRTSAYAATASVASGRPHATAGAGRTARAAGAARTARPATRRCAGA